MIARCFYRILAFLIAFSFAAAAAAQTKTPPASKPGAQKPYEPSVGQEGKDVVWVPTPQTLVNKMLDMAKVTPNDFVIDLGSGDGRTVITAAKRGSRAMGIEYNPDMVELSKKNAAEAGVGDRASFMKADLFETDLTKADVITMFLLQSINMRLRPTLLSLKPGTRIVSNTFDMEDWQADETATVDDDCSGWCRALLWIVPAKVDGMWQTPQGPMKLTQQFQMISGSIGGKQIEEGRLRGEEITFKANGQTYSGRVTGNSMKGTVSGGGSWTATRG